MKYPPFSWESALEIAIRYWHCTGMKCRVFKDGQQRWRSIVVDKSKSRYS